MGHGGSCLGYRTALLLMPEEKVATIVMANAQGFDSEVWAQRLYDIVAPSIHDAIESSEQLKPQHSDLGRYSGRYDAQPWGGEVTILPWEDGLALLSLPTMEPLKDLVRLKKSGEHSFTRIRRDEKLGEEITFEMGPDGRATRFIHNSNYYERVR